jgi:hypothetical protein
VQDCDLKELAVSDLDQIKQAGQGARDRRGFARGRSGNPEGRAAAATTSIALLAGEGEALTHKAVELALAGDPAALRLCLGRIVGPHREPTVEFTMPAIRNAADLAGPKG